MKTDLDRSAAGKVRGGGARIICPLCKGETFVLHTKLPAPTKVGHTFPVGTYTLDCAECATCGEVYHYGQGTT